ncbi:hypothetical protein [Roseibium sp. M-1]
MKLEYAKSRFIVTRRLYWINATVCRTQTTFDFIHRTISRDAFAGCELQASTLQPAGSSWIVGSTEQVAFGWIPPTGGDQHDTQQFFRSR